MSVNLVGGQRQLIFSVGLSAWTPLVGRKNQAKDELVRRTRQRQRQVNVDPGRPPFRVDTLAGGKRRIKKTSLAARDKSRLKLSVTLSAPSPSLAARDKNKDELVSVGVQRVKQKEEKSFITVRHWNEASVRYRRETLAVERLHDLQVSLLKNQTGSLRGSAEGVVKLSPCNGSRNSRRDS